MVKYTKQHISNKRKIIRDMQPNTITIHSTANPRSTAQNERDNLNRPGNTSSTGFHIVVDEKEAIECIPLNKVAYHAGDGRHGQGNSRSISIEMCESGNRDKVIQNTVKLTAKMLHERNWGLNELKRHYDWSGKNCPRILNYNNWQGWDKFKADVEKEMTKLSKTNDKPSKWAEQTWQWGIDNKITDGNRPHDTATREEVVALINKALNLTK